jgi:hypothetical protein
MTGQVSVRPEVETARKKAASLVASSLPSVRTPLQMSIPNGSTWQIASATFTAFSPPEKPVQAPIPEFGG